MLYIHWLIFTQTLLALLLFPFYWWRNWSPASFGSCVACFANQSHPYQPSVWKWVPQEGGIPVNPSKKSRAAEAADVRPVEWPVHGACIQGFIWQGIFLGSPEWNVDIASGSRASKPDFLALPEFASAWFILFLMFWGFPVAQTVKKPWRSPRVGHNWATHTFAFTF